MAQQKKRLAAVSPPSDREHETGKGLLDVYGQRRDVFFLVQQLRKIAGQCSVQQDVLALLPTRWEAFTSPFPDLANSALAFAKKIDEEKTEFESHFRDNRKRAAACAREIAYTINPDEESVAYDFAASCLKAHRTTLAYDVLERMIENADSVSKYVSAAKRRIAQHAWKTGDRDRAVMLMKSIRGRAARDQCRNWLAMLTIRNGLLIADSDNPAGARHVLIGALMATGLGQDTANAVARIYLQAASRAPQDDDLATGPHPLAKRNSGSVPRPVILSGFGWSGSGAIADFLKGHPYVTEAFSGRELGLWTGKFGLDRLYNHFVDKGFNRRVLLEFLTRHCFGHLFLGSSKGTKSAGGIWAWLDESQRYELLGALSRWLSEIHQWIEDPDYPILEPFKALSTEFLRLLSIEGSRHVLLSNCVPSNSITGVRMFSNPIVIVSWRNPADAYVSKKAAFPDLSAGIDGWQKQLKTRIEHYLAGKSDVVQHAAIWLDVGFEDFVRDATTRQQLLDHLALDSESMRSTFDPEVSARNIGISAAETDADSAGWRDLSAQVAAAKQEAADMSGNDRTTSTFTAGGKT